MNRRSVGERRKINCGQVSTTIPLNDDSCNVFAFFFILPFREAKCRGDRPFIPLG